MTFKVLYVYSRIHKKKKKCEPCFLELLLLGIYLLTQFSHEFHDRLGHINANESTFDKLKTEMQTRTDCVNDDVRLKYYRQVHWRHTVMVRLLTIIFAVISRGVQAVQSTGVHLYDNAK